MRPELFVIPFLNVSIKSYGTMMVIGFVAAMYLARWLARRYRENPEHISGFTVYAMIAGVVGARLFHVVHYFDQYRGNLLEVFKVWNGGLEFLGGFMAALAVSIYYVRRHRLQALKFMDILAPALMLGLGFGRIGCFLNGCCFGRPTDLPWAVTFPVYNTYTDFHLGPEPRQRLEYSHPFYYQLYPDPDRRPGQPALVQLPDEYYDGYIDSHNTFVESLDLVPAQERERFFRHVKPPGQLTDRQLEQMQPGGPCGMHPIHPTQLYSSLNGFGIMALLLLIHRRRFRAFDRGRPVAWGAVSGVLLMCYGVTRIVLEYLRADNPREFTGLTISQNLSVLAFVAGIGLLVYARKHLRRQPAGGCGTDCKK